MKYRHAFHAGNFADVHKHVTLLCLISALQRKPRGFLVLDTHAGAGLYRLQGAAARRTREAVAGIGRLENAVFAAPELRDYLDLVAAIREGAADPDVYPGSPLLAARRLRPVDRLVAIEMDVVEAAHLEAGLGGGARVQVERGDGYAGIRSRLPPPERRGLTLIDPPYEERGADFREVSSALVDGLQRFATGVYCAWYPIKDRRETDRWSTALARRLGREVLCAELWLHPTDSTAGLNGSGVVIVNPPWQIAERMREWLPELEARLRLGPAGGSRVEILNTLPAAV
jgi:23S rRNA (adenine2030-N6)-methyltransferase